MLDVREPRPCPVGCGREAPRWCILCPPCWRLVPRRRRTALVLALHGYRRYGTGERATEFSRELAQAVDAVRDARTSIARGRW